LFLSFKKKIQYKPLILDWFEIEFHKFFFSDFLFMNLSWSYDLDQGLGQLTWGFFYFIFFNFIIQYWVDWELSFIVYFGLCSMRLSWFYDLDHGFGWLTRVFFCVFFLIDFFYFILQYWVDCKLSFVICFDLLFMWLS